MAESQILSIFISPPPSAPCAMGEVHQPWSLPRQLWHSQQEQAHSLHRQQASQMVHKGRHTRRWEAGMDGWGLQYQLTHKLVIPKACTQDQGTTNLTHRLQAEPHLAQTNWPIRLANPLRLGSSSTITINTMQAYRSHAADIVCTQRYDPAPHGVQTQVPLGMNLSEFVHSHNFRLRVGG